MVYRKLIDELGHEIASFRIEGKFIRIKIGSDVKIVSRKLVFEIAKLLGISEKEALVEICKLIRDYLRKKVSAS